MESALDLVCNFLVEWRLLTFMQLCYYLHRLCVDTLPHLYIQLILLIQIIEDLDKQGTDNGGRTVFLRVTLKCTLGAQYACFCEI